MYVPVITLNTNYTGNVKLTCIGLNKENKVPPVLHFQSLYSFSGSDMLSVENLIHYSNYVDNEIENFNQKNCINHFYLEKCVSLNSLFIKSILFFTLAVKPLVIKNKTDQKTFPRVNLNVDEPFPLQTAVKFFMRPVPEKIHIFAQQMLDSKNGLSFELGYIAYDANFKCIEIIDTQKLSKSNGAVKLANDETGRFNKEAYSIVKLNQIPPEVFCLTFGISEVFNKKLNGSMGCFFRVYDAKDDFELMSFDGRRKGLYTSIWVFTMFRYNNNEWAIVPMNRSYNDRGLVKGMLALSQHIKEDMQKEKYFDRMYAQIKIDF